MVYGGIRYVKVRIGMYHYSACILGELPKRRAIGAKGAAGAARLDFPVTGGEGEVMKGKLGHGSKSCRNRNNRCADTTGGATPRFWTPTTPGGGGGGGI